MFVSVNGLHLEQPSDKQEQLINQASQTQQTTFVKLSSVVALYPMLNWVQLLVVSCTHVPRTWSFVACIRHT